MRFVDPVHIIRESPKKIFNNLKIGLALVIIHLGEDSTADKTVATSEENLQKLKSQRFPFLTMFLTCVPAVGLNKVCLSPSLVSN